MKIIFETSLQGHRYEYLHNLYLYAGKELREKILFVLPQDERVDLWKKDSFHNVALEYFSKEELKSCLNKNLLLASYYKAKVLNKYIKKYSASSVFLIFLMLYMPFILFFLPKGVKVSGIIYRSFLWEDSTKQSSARRRLEWLRYLLMAKSSKVDRVLLLNDLKSALAFNIKFATSKFVRLPDPYTPLDGKLYDAKEKLNIDKDDNLFIQIGQLSGRKGTLEILDALSMLTSDEAKHNYFCFAGKVAGDIYEQFYIKVEELKNKGVHILVRDEYISSEMLNSLCASCDCMLTPYKNTNQSSGAIGYAAQFGKPVIGPSKGLLGHLIKHYKLGYQINNVSSLELYRAISTFKHIPVPDDYVKENQLSDFLKLCLD